MRMIGLAGSVAVLLAACGGGEKQTQQPAADTTAAAPPAAASATHNINMEFDGTNYKFVPNALTVKPGDKVVFHNVSGGPHNIQFFADSVPAESKMALDAAMPGDKLGELNGPLLVTEGETYEISFAGLVSGIYHLTCTPHQAMNMNMAITVQP